jgi:hypothetical protein
VPLVELKFLCFNSEITGDSLDDTISGTDQCNPFRTSALDRHEVDQLVMLFLWIVSYGLSAVNKYNVSFSLYPCVSCTANTNCRQFALIP